MEKSELIPPQIPDELIDEEQLRTDRELNNVFLTMLVETGLIDKPVEQKVRECKDMKDKIDNVLLSSF